MSEVDGAVLKITCNIVNTDEEDSHGEDGKIRYLINSIPKKEIPSDEYGEEM